MEQKHIKLNCSFQNKDEILNEVMKTMIESGVPKEYVDSIKVREQEASFNIGCGIVIPHGTYDASKLLKTSQMFVWHLKEKITWDDEDASLIIGLAIKDNQQLEILQNIAVNSQDEKFFNDLIKNPTNKKIINLMLGE